MSALAQYNNIKKTWKSDFKYIVKDTDQTCTSRTQTVTVKIWIPEKITVIMPPTWKGTLVSGCVSIPASVHPFIKNHAC